MKIRILTIGKLKEKYLVNGINEYVKRLNAYCKVEMVEVPDEPIPDNASETLRIVQIGDYDICACIGTHVNNTSEIGKFKIISTDYTDGRFRIRFKLENP